MDGAVLNKLIKSDLIQLILNTEAQVGSQIAKLTIEVKDLLAHSKKLVADVAIVRNLKNKLVKRVVPTKFKCWENVQYSVRDTLKVIGIPTSLRDNVLEQRICELFQEIGVSRGKWTNLVQSIKKFKIIFIVNSFLQ